MRAWTGRSSYVCFERRRLEAGGSTRGATLDATLTRFLKNAAVDAEAAAARVRRVVLPLFALRLIVAQWQEVIAGVPKHMLSLACLATGLLVSEFLLTRVKTAEQKQPWLMASVLLDVVVAYCVCLWGVLWPVEGYVGFLTRPDWACFPVLAIAGGLRLSRAVTATGSLFATLALVALIGIDMGLNASLILSPPGEMLLAVVFMVVAAILGDAYANRVLRLVSTGAAQAVQGERARQRLGAYVSEEVAAMSMLEDGAHLGGEQRDVAVLFSDLRGFTSYSEGLAPDALVTELNAYLEALVPAIRAHGGVVDKYIGDAIMAVFGVPNTSGDEASRAIRAAEAMQAALKAHNADRQSRGLPELVQGIGVHYGRVVAGHVGTQERLQYTVIGDTVNVASRLESATKTEHVPVLLSDAVVTQARLESSALPSLVAHGRVPIRGRAGDQLVHTLARSGSPDA